MFSKLSVEKKESVRLGYLIFVLIYTAYFLVCMTRNCFSAATAQVVNEGLMTKSQMGLITASFYFVYAALQIPGGILADRVKPIILILLGVIGTFISNVAIYLNSNFYVMLVFWILNGISQMGFWPAVLKVLATNVISKNVKNSTFIFSTSTPVGYSLAYFIAAFVKRWQDNFLVSACIMVGVFFMLISFSKILGGIDTSKQETGQEDSPKEDVNIIKILIRSGFVLVIPAVFLWQFIKTGTASLMSTMLMQSYENVPPSLGNILTSVSVLSGIIGVLLVKIILDKSKKLNQLSVFELSFLVLLPFWLFMPKIGKINFWFVAFVLYLTQVMTAMGQLIINIDYVLVFKRFGREGSVAGIVNSVASFSVAANYGCAKIADCFGWRIFNISMLVLLVLINVLMIVVLPIWGRFLKDIEKN